MKLQDLTSYTLAIAAALLLSACASTPQDAAAAPSDSDTLADKYQGMESQAQDSRDLGAARAIDNPDNALLQQTRLHFDFDEAGIKPEYQAVLEAHAKHLREHPQKRLVLEGHADERGTREYNMALGERRAHNVEQAMILMGVHKSQLDPTSLGEEVPLVTSRGEESYYQNRRVELKYGQDPQISQNTPQTW